MLHGFAARAKWEVVVASSDTLVCVLNSETVPNRGLSWPFPFTLVATHRVASGAHSLVLELTGAPTDMWFDAGTDYLTYGSVEEAQDMEPVDVTPPSVERAVATARPSTALTEGEVLDHMAALEAADNLPSLAAAFSAAWTHAGSASDNVAREKFKQAYDHHKAQMTGGAA
jgi:hypothetical protein